MADYQLEGTTLEALALQLQQVINSRDPLNYLEQNVNYELELTSSYNKSSLPSISNDYILERAEFDLDLDHFKLSMHSDTPSLDSIRSRNFRRWIRGNKFSYVIVRKGMCKIVNIIKEAIDEEKTLKIILGLIFTALITVLSIPISVIVSTIVVTILADMILNGVDYVCPV